MDIIKLNCPECGSPFEYYLDTNEGTCLVCGYSPKQKDIDAYFALKKKKEKDFIEEKQLQEKEKKRIEDEKKQIEKQIILEKTKEERKKREEEEVIIKRKQAEEERKRKAEAEKRRREKEKRKKEFSKKIRSIANNFGIVIFTAFVAAIVVTTIFMTKGGVSGGWIFFIVCAVISIVASYLSYTSFHENVTKDFAYVMASGLLGALVTASTISDGWLNGILDMFNEGFLVVLFSGWLVFIFFVFVSVITIILSIVITQVLPSYIQAKTNGFIGGLIGLIISSICAFFYLYLFEQEGLALVLGGLKFR